MVDYSFSAIVMHAPLGILVVRQFNLQIVYKCNGIFMNIKLIN